MYQTNLDILTAHAAEREHENDNFHAWLRDKDDAVIDTLAHELNDTISAAIDCTECGNCCKNLVINVEPEDTIRTAKGLALTTEDLIDKYIETSAAGKYFVNTIPCHFFADKKCTIYEHRFTDCREFPHLHKDGFKQRLLGTMMHYGKCPIIYNVIEGMKERLGFEGDMGRNVS